MRSWDPGFVLGTYQMNQFANNWNLSGYQCMEICSHVTFLLRIIDSHSSSGMSRDSRLGLNVMQKPCFYCKWPLWGPPVGISH